MNAILSCNNNFSITAARLPIERHASLRGMNSFGLAASAGLLVRPGMLADVTVVTGERTFMNYLMKPFRERLLVAFKEE